MKDKNGTELLVGDTIEWMGRKCKILKFDKTFKSLIEVDDPGATLKFCGAKKTERYLRGDEVVKVDK